MREGLSIRGLGAVGSFGAGRSALAKALREPGSTFGRVPLQGALESTLCPAHRADTAPLDAFIPRRTVRRADTFSRLALLGACLALEDAGLPLSDLGEDTALVLASAQGATGSTLALLDTIIQDGDACSSPTHFAHSLHNSAAAYVSILLGIRGPSLTLSQGWNSVPSALLSARSLLRSGRAARVVFGAVEELSAIPALYWQQVAPGRLPGEGAVFLILEAEGHGEGPRLMDGSLFGELPLESATTWHLGNGPDPMDWDLADRFGLSQALPAFHLASACLLLQGTELRERPNGRPDRVICRWQLPQEGSASCQVA